MMPACAPQNIYNFKHFLTQKHVGLLMDCPSTSTTEVLGENLCTQMSQRKRGLQVSKPNMVCSSQIWLTRWTHRWGVTAAGTNAASNMMLQLAPKLFSSPFILRSSLEGLRSQSVITVAPERTRFQAYCYITFHFRWTHTHTHAGPRTNTHAHTVHTRSYPSLHRFELVCLKMTNEWWWKASSPNRFLLVFRLSKDHNNLSDMVWVCVCVGVFHTRRSYILVTEVSSPEGMKDYFPLVPPSVCECKHAWVCVCRVMANDYLHIPLFGLELCVFGHSDMMTPKDWNLRAFQMKVNIGASSLLLRENETASSHTPHS